MKRSMRVLSLVMSLLLFVALLPVDAKAADEEYQDAQIISAGSQQGLFPGGSVSNEASDVTTYTPSSSSGLMLIMNADGKNWILPLADKSGSAVCVLSEDCFAKIATSQTPQPIMAVAEKRTWQMRDVFSPGGNVLVLDRIQDPGNLGTLLRTAEATGFAGALIVKGGADPYGPKAVRAGAGCVFRFPLLLCESPAEALDILAKQRKQVWTADMEGTPCYDAELAQNVAIVIGNEGNGADALFKENSGRVTVPMAGQTESLNAGIAAAILMYESLRQRAARSVRENTATL